MNALRATSRSRVTGWGLVLGGTALAALLMDRLAQSGEAIPAIGPIPAEIVFYLILFVPLIAIATVLGRIEQVRPWRGGAHPQRWFAIGLGLGLGAYATALGYSWIAGAVVTGPSGQAGIVALLGALALVLFQSASEELFFRGWLLPSLIDKCGGTPAIVLSAAAFALFHLLGGSRAPISLVNLMLGGIWFALLATRSGGIVAPIAAHFAWNGLESPILGLDPNPGSGNFGSLVDLDLVGASHWGGSPEGMNASLGMSIVLLAMIVVLAWRPRPVPATPALT